jgi:hypothetical protein
MSSKPLKSNTGASRLNRFHEQSTYVQRVGSPNCRVLLDAFHLNIEQDSIRDAIRHGRGPATPPSTGRAEMATTRAERS